ncbi:hypothetical protein K445DRAFT_7090 [Daldinia sp. EC12]|nr:hypothetical protein K445DRAFT_7090 [Daldinia sp. EC12]
MGLFAGSKVGQCGGWRYGVGSANYMDILLIQSGLPLGRRQASTNQNACAKFGLAADNFDFANRFFHAKHKPGNGAGGLGFCGNAALLHDARMAIWAASGSLDMELSARNIEFAIGNNPFVMIYTTYLGRPNTYLGFAYQRYGNRGVRQDRSILETERSIGISFLRAHSNQLIGLVGPTKLKVNIP